RAEERARAEHREREIDDPSEESVDQAAQQPQAEPQGLSVEGDGLAREDLVRGDERARAGDRHASQLTRGRGARSLRGRLSAQPLSWEAMNLDAMIDERRAEWERLDVLARRKHLTGAETDEFVHLYRAASSDLAGIKTSVGRSPVA